MPTENHDSHVLSRRTFAGLGLAAGATAMGALPETHSVAAAPNLLPRPEAFGTINPVLSYLPIDPLAFDAIEFGQDRYFTDAAGVQSLNSGHYLAAPIPLPAGSTIFQINIAYRSSPICEIRLRDLTTTNYATPFQQTLPNSAGFTTITYDIPGGIVIGDRTTAVFAFYSSGGSALFGVTLAYQPPTQSFIPFSGPTPRAYDSRDPANGKLLAGQERIIPLGFAGVRGAVLNVTVTNTAAGGGFVSVYAANIAWPGNSSVNWTAAGQKVANGVITAVDSSGRMKIRASAATDFIVDRIGWLV